MLCGSMTHHFNHRFNHFFRQTFEININYTAKWARKKPQRIADLGPIGYIIGEKGQEQAGWLSGSLADIWWLPAGADKLVPRIKLLRMRDSQTIRAQERDGAIERERDG